MLLGLFALDRQETKHNLFQAIQVHKEKKEQKK